MIKEVLANQISGSLKAPASKSVAQRAIAIAALAEGTSRILSVGDSDDVMAAIRVCRAMGVDLQRQGDDLIVNGGVTPGQKMLDCGESGLGIRMFSAIAASFSDTVTLTGTGSLKRRPMGMIEKSLISAGVKCKTTKGFLPVKVKGPLPGGLAEIDGSVSSQVLTGLLMAAPYASKPVTFKVNNLRSKPYIDITIKIMNDFGVVVENTDYESFFIDAPQKYMPTNYKVEGDWSGAAFMLVAGALGGEIVVNNLDVESTQADRAIVQALWDCGARIVSGPDFLQVCKSQLKAFEFDATHCPDLFPPLVALAAGCNGTSVIRGVGRLRVKESDRALALTSEFSKMGLDIRVEDDLMFIKGGRLQGARVHSHHDHRIAMATAVASLLCNEPVIIEDSHAITKSYPAFFEDFSRISIQ
jgi:3-phosphoshikimate 1-carboxyvinyltransferase